MSSVAAVVVRWRGGAEVERCLSSVLENAGANLAEVVLVDSGSGDDGAEQLAATFPAVQVVALAENRSFAWAAGEGVRACRASRLLLLNPDTEPSVGAVDTLSRFLDDNPDAAGAVPLLANADGSSQHLWQLRRLPTAWRLATGRPGAPLFPSAPPRTPAPVPQPAAAAWLVRRRVWDALGGLDPAFAPAWWEDVDFCARLDAGCGGEGFPTAEGFWVVPDARIVHSGGSSLAHMETSAFLAAYHRNLLRYARRHLPRTASAVALGVRATLVAKAAARPRQAGAFLQALRSL